VITLLVVGAIAWVLTGAVEDTIRSARGREPRSERRGLRGYLDDRWQALADHHHAVAASGLLTAGGARLARRHLARTKALKLAGIATDEEVAKAKKEHQHRLGYIVQGIDPDTMPPLFPRRGKNGAPVPWEPPADPAAQAKPDPLLETDDIQEPAPTVDDHVDSNTDIWGTEFPDASPDPWAQEPWSPYAPTDNTTKENNMSNNGEIAGPADVKQFHDDLMTVMDGTATACDTLQGRSAELQTQVDDVTANLTATETAAAGMRNLGMTDAAAAADALLEVQGSIHDAILQLRLDHDTAVAELTDQVEAAKAHLAAILAAHDGQLAVQDARAGAGHGNLATDDYLDNND
jgi:hypothetical protein